MIKLIGRASEWDQVKACVDAQRNVLLEGAVGVGKTHLALAVLDELKRSVYRIDGDSRYSEQKLTGWFDPPAVLKKGFSKESFIPGPLTLAMQTGGVLFINELNRLPEGVQNVLLQAIDEKMIVIPKLGELKAKKGFVVIATQNPKEFVATSHLSEAILDRFELVVLDYQTESEENQIVENYLSQKKVQKQDKGLIASAVRLVRLTRIHPKIRRGASVRAAMSIAELAHQFLKHGKEKKESFLMAAILALPTRIEIEREVESTRSHREELERLIESLVEDAEDVQSMNEKKKTS